MNENTHFIGIDWGTTNARALLFDREGALLEERDEPLGVRHIPAGGYRAAFERLTTGWRAPEDPIPAILSGMVGSRHGWREAPFIHCPAALTELHRSLVPAPEVERAFILPGVCLTGARRDVMRGEELQLLGLGEAATAFDCVCIPGTHSKWIRSEWPHVREFHTAMTGELFAAISEHTLFAKLIAPAASPRSHGRAFTDGLERSASSHGLPEALFAIRADLLLDYVKGADVADLISGLLIGTEIRHALARTGPKPRVALLASAGLEERYLAALRFFGVDAVAFDVRQTTARGFSALFCALDEIGRR